MMIRQQSSKRCVKVASELKKRLSTLCLESAADPVIRMTSITKVEVSPDLSWANIHLLSAKHQEKKVLKAFQGFSPKLRTLLASEWAMKKMPKFRYCYDHSEIEARKIRALLDE